MKLEVVTPVPKISQPKSVDDLRKISGLNNLNKIFEKIICRYMIKDMKSNMDPSQYGNTPGVSIIHYLIKLIDRVLKATNNRCKGESVAV